MMAKRTDRPTMTATYYRCCLASVLNALMTAWRRLPIDEEASSYLGRLNEITEQLKTHRWNDILIDNGAPMGKIVDAVRFRRKRRTG